MDIETLRKWIAQRDSFSILETIDVFTGERKILKERMNNILPGWIDSLPKNDERAASVPMKRYGTSEEIAKTVVFLASEGAGYITGQNLRVDGGLTRSV